MIVKKQPNPLALETLKELSEHTPDWISLKYGSYDEFPVFVFGTLQKFRINNKMMEDAKYYGKALTFNKTFIAKQPPSNRGGLFTDPLVFNTLQYQPSFLKKEGLDGLLPTQKNRHLEGEVFGVPLRKLAEIDRFSSNTDGFERIKTWVRLLDPSQDNASFEAYMYVVDLDYFLDIYSPETHLDDCRTMGYKRHADAEMTHAYIF